MNVSCESSMSSATRTAREPLDNKNNRHKCSTNRRGNHRRSCSRYAISNLQEGEGEEEQQTSQHLQSVACSLTHGLYLLITTSLMEHAASTTVAAEPPTIETFDEIPSNPSPTNRWPSVLM